MKSEQNVCDYSRRHPYKDLLGVRELTHYVKLLHQVIKLARRTSCCKLDYYTENRSSYKSFLETDSELTVNDDLVLKSNRIVTPSDLQNYVVPLVH